MGFKLPARLPIWGVYGYHVEQSQMKTIPFVPGHH